MLVSMTVRNIALIEQLQIEFQKGMQVLSGETGAGKSIIVDSINLVLGERADRGLIRSGCDRASVEALVDISDCPQAAAVLADGTAAAHVMGAGSGFTYYQFDLTKLTDKDGAAAANAADVLGRVADMQFTVEDSGDGAVYLDEIQFSTGRFAEEAVQVPGDETDTTVSTTPSTGSPTDEDVQTPSTGLPASAGIAGVLLALSGLLSVVFYKKRLA